MKRLISAILVLVLFVSVLGVNAFAARQLSEYSDDELKQLYELVREEMTNRGLPLAQEITLRKGKFIVGQDILPGSYTIKCTETFGDTYGSGCSPLGGLFGGDLGGMMGSLGGMMGDLINAQVKILGDYGTELKSFELGIGDTARVTLQEGTALQISDGTCVLIAD